MQKPLRSVAEPSRTRKSAASSRHSTSTTSLQEESSHPKRKGHNQESGYIVIDFDHIPDPDGLIVKLAKDDNFETVLAFRSPSGDGVKWIVSRPALLLKEDGKPYSHTEFFTILSNYARKYYGVEADPSGKDICRACFLHTIQTHF